MPTSVACSRPGISERLTGDRDELPGVAPCTERQLEHAERAGPPLAVRRGRGPEGPGAFTARAHHEFADSQCRIGYAVGCLWSEALVQVLMPVEEQLGPRRVQLGPELAVGGGSGRRAGVGREEERLVRDGQRALLG